MHDIELIKILAFGLLIALVMGYITRKIRLSPIVGYLIAGFIVGPYVPGYTANAEIASQLAEAGVILLMFGVGLHFNLKELIAVKKIAIFGAVLQSFFTTIIGMSAAVFFGLSLISGVIIGMGLSVASTVVLLKMLEDSGIIDTKHGHIVIGWLIAEDILTVLALVILPVFGHGTAGYGEFIITLFFAFGKVILYGVITLLLGGKVIPWILTKVAQTKSRELFTLTILAIAFSIATVASIYFGVSFALGAFLAGMVVGNTSLHTEATANILPMRDAFSVIFFLSVGMLVNPISIYNNISLVIVCFLIVVIIKPIIAFILVLLLGYSVRTALTAAVGLAQIGEFSFILVQEAQSLKLINQEIYSIIIGCSIVSIFLNPILFKLMPYFENLLMKNVKVWKILNIIVDKKNKNIIEKTNKIIKEKKSKSILIGYGPVGKRVFEELNNNGEEPVIIELNIDTVNELTDKSIPAVYGDAVRKDVLISAGIKDAKEVYITLPDLNNIINVVSEIIKINKNIRIYSRVRYKGSEEILKGMGVYAVFVEEDAVSKIMAEGIGRTK